MAARNIRAFGLRTISSGPLEGGREYIEGVCVLKWKQWRVKEVHHEKGRMQGKGDEVWMEGADQGGFWGITRT